MLALIPSEYIVSAGIGLLLFGLYIVRALGKTNERVARLEAWLEALREERKQ